MKREVEESNSHRMAKVYDLLDMWQGSLNLHVAQKKSQPQNKQMKAVGYIPDTEEIVTAS
jgi:hypothetical protein